MADAFAILSTINTYQPDLQRELGDQAGAFFAEVDALKMEAITGAGDMTVQAQTGDKLLILVDKYRPARRLLRRVDPATFGPPNPADDASTRDAAAGSPIAPTATPATAGPSVPAAGTLDSTPAAPAATATPRPTAPASPASPPASGVATPTVTPAPPPAPAPTSTITTEHPAPAPASPGPPAAIGAQPGGPSTALTPSRTQEMNMMSTPDRQAVSTEERIQLLKEYVAATLGIVLVVGTVILAFMAFLGNSTDANFQHLKDVLLILNGLSGVVLGYYFGRIPSDARASQAQKQVVETQAQAQQQVAVAQQQAQQAQTRALEVIDQVQELADQTAPGSAADTRGLESASGVDIHQKLRDIARQARNW